MNTALTKLESQGTYRSDAEVDVSIASRLVGKKAATPEGSMRFFMTQRMLPMVENTQDGEGQLKVETFNLTNEAFPVTLTEPLSLEWKKVDAVLYVRLEKIPQSLADGLKELEFDLSSVVGQWYRLDLKGDSLIDQLPLALPVSSLVPVSSQLATLKVKPLLQVIRVEKKEKRADGQVISRLRVRLNPALVSALQREELKKIVRSTPNRLAELQAIAKRYMEMRKVLSNLHMVAMVNETTGSLERMEFGLKQTEPKKTCEWSTRYGRSICKVTSYETITVAAGMSFLPDSGAPIEVPAVSKTFEEALEAFKPEPPTELLEDMPMEM